MKLVRFGAPGQEKPGLIDKDGNLRDLSEIISDIDSKLLGSDLAQLKTIDEASLPLIEGEQRFAKPVASVGKCICVGLNYADHAAESGMKVPIEPVLFAKATSSLQGAYDDVVLPPGS
ncbi:MAG: 2,4-diketo-3-deoxy-L-fuconate hydrolase, partial [Colwellia sp.]